MKNRKLQVWLPFLFALFTAIGIFLGFKMRDAFPLRSFFSVSKPNPLQEVLSLIQNKYVDTVNTQNISDSAIRMLLTNLDPHSIYIPAKDLQQINEEIQGSFYGIGIEFSMYDDTLNVTNVLKDGPSFKAGLKIGDKILKADGTPVSGQKIKTDKIRELLRGNLNTVVNVEILRGKEIKNVEIMRGNIPVSSIDADYMIDSTIGYIRINKFTSNTYREFMESLMGLKKQGLKSLVLDLRDNGGGVLDEAVEIADEFLSGDKLITYTEGAHIARKEYRARRLGQFEDGKLAVLVDEGSASASEILVGALQDWNRATIIGRRTFGKGLVQEQFNLSDRSALRLTVARYYTPVGRSIQRPYNLGSKAYFDDITQRSMHGEMYIQDSIKNDSSLIFKTPSGKYVFGGGGITPDIFVNSDTSKIGYYSAAILSKGVLNDYGYKYYLANPGLASQYKTSESFVKDFRVSDEDWSAFETMLAKDSVSLIGISDKEKAFIKKLLRTSIARQLYRSKGYYETVNQDDTIMIKAIDALHKN